MSKQPDSNRNILASAPIWRALVHLCVPMIAGVSVGAVYNIINGGFIGSLHSTALLAAMTFSMPVFALIMAIAGVFGVGGGTYISRLLGREESAGEAAQPAASVRARSVSAFTFWGALLTGAVLGLVGVFFATPLAAAVGANGESLAPTAVYITLLFAFMPVSSAAFALEQVVRAEGAAKASMIGLIASTLANLLFDVLFILILPWGVAGAGLALGLSNLVMLGYYVWWIRRYSTSSALAARLIRVDREMLRSVFGIGVSELLQASFLIVTTLVMNWVSVAYGDALLASMGVALRISQLPEMICMGVFMGVLPLLAFAFGAGQVQRLRRAMLGSAAAIAGITVLFSGTVFLFRDQVFALFSADPTVLDDGTRILTAMLVATLFNGFTGLIIAYFQATEQMRNATIMALSQGVLFVPVVLLGRAILGLNGVIWAMTATELMCFVLAGSLVLAARKPVLDAAAAPKEPQSAVG